ncbi:MAG: tetratricopeptide repeat protein [Streptosporangiales bacterium]|nr:tetratricopeptide repeat protein [Streptosporangiales bacterium]
MIQYQENFGFPIDDERRRFLFNIHGDAGVGKTFLAGQLRQIASDAGALTAHVDETAEDVTSAMTAMAEQFSRSGNKLGDFEKRVAQYQQRRHELESDPHAPAGVAAFLTKTAITVGLAAARDIPVAGSILAPVDVAAAADQANQAREYVAKRLSDHRDVRLLLSPADELTPVFVDGLNRIAAGRTVALFFDTYERTGSLLDDWLRGLYAGRYGDLPETLITTISGQKPLDPNLWGEYLPVIADIPLEPFSDTEARQFLASKAITDEPTIRIILRLSGRLPLWLATLADARSQGSADIGDPSGNAVERFLKWEDDPARREVAMTAALPRVLNQDVLAVISPADEARDLFAWLRGLPFVTRRGESWVYHEVVRDAMLRLQRAEAPAKWRTEQNRLAQANVRWGNDAAMGADKPWENSAWVDCAREEIYHLLCADPHRNLSQALASAVKAAGRGVIRARQWAVLIADAGRDTGNEQLKEWGQRLTDCIRDDDLSLYLTCLINDAWLDRSDLALAYKERGFALHDVRRYEDALSDFSRAIEIDPGAARTIAGRGDVLRHLGRFESALGDYDSALEISPESVRFIRGRGDVYHDMRRYEDALSDFSRAIEIDPGAARTIACRGDVLRHLGRLEDALGDYDRAVELSPKSAWMVGGRGDVYHDMGRYEDALSDFNAALEIAPDNIQIIVDRGDIYIHMRCYEDGLADLTRAIQQDPKNVWAVARRGDAYRLMGRYEDALADLNRAIELDPLSVWAVGRRGLTYTTMRQYDSALDDINTVVALDASLDAKRNSLSRSSYYVSIAVNLLASDRRAAAAKMFEALSVLWPNDPELLNDWGFCLMPESPDAALELLARASGVKGNKELITVANQLRCFLGLNRRAEALAIAERIVGSLGLYCEESAFMWSLDVFALENVRDVRMYIIDVIDRIVDLSGEVELSRQWKPVLTEARIAVN